MAILQKVLVQFQYLQEKVLLTTHGEFALPDPITLDVRQLKPCTHEEADTRIMLHIAHAYQSGHQHCKIHATDIDIVLLAIDNANAIHGVDLWIAFGHGNHFRYISALIISKQLGNVVANGMLFMHAVSGCDTSFCGVVR